MIWLEDQPCTTGQGRSRKIVTYKLELTGSSIADLHVPLETLPVIFLDLVHNGRMENRSSLQTTISPANNTSRRQTRRGWDRDRSSAAIKCRWSDFEYLFFFAMKRWNQPILEFEVGSSGNTTIIRSWLWLCTMNGFVGFIQRYNRYAWGLHAQQQINVEERRQALVVLPFCVPGYKASTPVV